jgi:sugar/nucleoside kinase (ribokinase family)
VKQKKIAMVFGDLTLDVRAHISEPSHLVDIDHGINVEFSSDVEGAIGGTAWLAAKALQAVDVEPVVFSGVGDDVFGQAILAAVRAAGLSPVGIATVTEAGTCCVGVSYFAGGTRLMIRPRTHANLHLPRETVDEALQQLDLERIALCFVSGYGIINADSPTALAIRHACATARRADVPVVLDLVPHDFRSHIGDISDAENLVGPCDGFVAELSTAAELLSPRQTSDDKDLMTDLAHDLARGRSFAVVQHRTGANIYSQAVASKFRTEVFHYEIDHRSLFGVGDRLLADALVKLAIF